MYDYYHDHSQTYLPALLANQNLKIQGYQNLWYYIFGIHIHVFIYSIANRMTITTLSILGSDAGIYMGRNSKFVFYVDVTHPQITTSGIDSLGKWIKTNTISTRHLYQITNRLFILAIFTLYFFPLALHPLRH